MKHTMLRLLLISPAVYVASLAFSVPVLAQDLSKGFYKIYSNLGPEVKGTCYDPHEAWVVGLGQAIAMPFTPKVDASVSEIVLGLLYVTGGKDIAIVSLDADDNGLPGKAIHTWNVARLGKYRWHSCYVSIAKSKKGLPLKAGTRYWVVGAAPSATWDIWAYTYNDITGNFAYEENNGGWNADDSYLSAFGVFGTK